jgi:hypothetical protein
LIDHGADIDATEHVHGQTALMWAVDQRQAPVVRTLLARGANVHARSAVWQQLENTAGNTNSAGDFLMSHGGSSAILLAARHGDLETATALLDAGAHVNDSDAAGTSALVIAAHSDHGQLARFLLLRGADPNAAEAGYTALPPPCSVETSSSSRRCWSMARIRTLRFGTARRAAGSARTTASAIRWSAPTASGWPRDSAIRTSCACSQPPARTRWS